MGAGARRMPSTKRLTSNDIIIFEGNDVTLDALYESLEPVWPLDRPVTSLFQVFNTLLYERDDFFYYFSNFQKI